MGLIFIKYVIPLLIIIGIFVSGYFYITWSQAKIIELSESIVGLQVTVQTQDLAIKAMAADVKVQTEINQQAQTEITALRQSYTEVVLKIQSQAAQFVKKAQTQPRQVETLINANTAASFAGFESLTKKDFNAAKPTR